MKFFKRIFKRRNREQQSRPIETVEQLNEMMAYGFANMTPEIAKIIRDGAITADKIGIPEPCDNITYDGSPYHPNHPNHPKTQSNP